uniref:Peroxiredoxin-like 2A n=1 Tax=Pavo cristatus TaxID=9049 RepID=A0A8C9FKG5_PAVCR
QRTHLEIVWLRKEKECLISKINEKMPLFTIPTLDRSFYGPRKRKMVLSGFFRVGVWQNFFRAWKNGYSGNLEGEGFTLGGVYVIGAGRQGVLLEHREKEFGDKVSLPSVLEAAEKIKPQASEAEK